MAAALEFWPHYSAINESAQDDMANEKDGMLMKMADALAAYNKECGL